MRSFAFRRRLEQMVDICPPLAGQLYRVRYGRLGPYLGYGFAIPSWLGRQEGLALASACYTLPYNSVVVEIGSYEGTAATVAATWTEPIDMLLFDGDQSPEGARLAYDAWEPFLRVGGVIALHNSNDRSYAPGTTGRASSLRELGVRHATRIHCIESTTFARRVS